MEKKIDLLAAGELLADFITVDECESLIEGSTFARYQGGSPANLAANLARLGKKTVLVASVGSDGVGYFLKNEIAKTGIDIESIVMQESIPTSLVLVSRTSGTPDFVAYRLADRMLQFSDISVELIAQSRLFHTTCFALSMQPARDALLDSARLALESGASLSIDLNYHPQIWPNRREALRIVSEFCSTRTLVKCSMDDMERLLDAKDLTVEHILQLVHSWGADLVCLTRGSKGSITSWNGGEEQYLLKPKPLKVVDATGAGDAFWSGFLASWLEGLDPASCARVGGEVAAIKLTRTGPLPADINFNSLASAI